MFTRAPRTLAVTWKQRRLPGIMCDHRVAPRPVRRRKRRWCGRQRSPDRPPTLGVPGGPAPSRPRGLQLWGREVWGAAETSGSWALEERQEPGLEGGALGKRRCDMPRASCRESGECLPESDYSWDAG